jgi:hypothetical protein
VIEAIAFLIGFPFALACVRLADRPRAARWGHLD